MTSKPCPNSEPTLLLCHWAPSARFIFLPSANSNGDSAMMGLIFSPRARARSLARATAMTRFIFSPSSPRAILGTPPPEPRLLSPPATCDCRPAANMLLATLGGWAPVNGFRNRGERRPCPTAKQRWARGEPVALTLTACHRFSSPAFSETWLFAPPVSRFTVNKKAHCLCLVSLLHVTLMYQESPLFCL